MVRFFGVGACLHAIPSRLGNRVQARSYVDQETPLALESVPAFLSVA
jgi:hypothetical protein